MITRSDLLCFIRTGDVPSKRTDSTRASSLSFGTILVSIRQCVYSSRKNREHPAQFAISTVILDRALDRKRIDTALEIEAQSNRICRNCSFHRWGRHRAEDFLRWFSSDTYKDTARQSGLSVSLSGISAPMRSDGHVERGLQRTCHLIPRTASHNGTAERAGQAVPGGLDLEQLYLAEFGDEGV